MTALVFVETVQDVGGIRVVNPFQSVPSDLRG